MRSEKKPGIKTHVAGDEPDLPKTTENLVESETKFRNLFEHSSIGKSMTGLDGKIMVNQAYCDFVGYSKEELLTKKWQELTHPDDLLNDEMIARELINGEQDSARWEKRYIHKNGQILWAEVRSLIERDEKGKPLYFITNVLDISERKEAEFRLQKLNRTYALHSGISQAIIRVHEPKELFKTACNIAVSQGKFIMAWIGLTDPGTHKVVPVASAGKVETYLDNLNINMDDPERGQGPTAAALRSGKHEICNNIAKDPRMGPWRQQALDLGYRSSAVFPFNSVGNFRGAITLYAAEPDFFNDEELKLLDELAANIAFALEFAEEEAKRKKAEEDLLAAKDKAELSDRLKSAFLANMSHEIRTPMNAIVGFAGMLNETSLTAEERSRFTSIIQSRSDDLMHIISDILEISRIESGNATVVKGKVCLNSLIDETEEVFRQKIERTNKKHLALISEKLLTPEGSRILTDGYILKQVFSNLIDNAIKFTESGSIRFGYHFPSDGMISCYVTDTGIGIDPESQKIIFEHFRQAETRDPHKYGGTGLGLSICKGSLALLGGDIWVESQPCRGSTFQFRIPYEPEINPVTPPVFGTRPHLNKAKFDWSGKKIILVEDEPTNMEFLQIVLGKTNAELLPVFNGRELRELYENLATIDLVMLDIRLPDANGWDLAKEIKSRCPSLPVIAQTAYAMSADKKMSDDSGCDNYISKPIRKEKLLEVLSKYL